MFADMDALEASIDALEQGTWVRDAKAQTVYPAGQPPCAGHAAARFAGVY